LSSDPDNCGKCGKICPPRPDIQAASSSGDQCLYQGLWISCSDCPSYPDACVQNNRCVIGCPNCQPSNDGHSSSCGPNARATCGGNTMPCTLPNGLRTCCPITKTCHGGLCQ